jgi:hypothetical protein
MKLQVYYSGLLKVPKNLLPFIFNTDKLPLPHPAMWFRPFQLNHDEKLQTVSLIYWALHLGQMHYECHKERSQYLIFW